MEPNLVGPVGHNMAMTLTMKTVCRLASVHLVDSFLCSNASQYLSAILLSLNIMMSLELPHVNVLSKIDLIESRGELAFSLEYYSEVCWLILCILVAILIDPCSENSYMFPVA